jgi:DNA-binding beta-propeller fold protein YncE
VTDNYDLCTISCSVPSKPVDNALSIYAVSSTGTLSEQPNSPYAIAAPDPISVIAVNTNQPGENSGGVFAFVGNQAASAGSLNPFQLCTVQNSNCSQQDVTENLLVPVTCAPETSCSVSAGSNPIEMVVDPTNSFLYSIAELSNQIFAFRINTTTGTLAALSPNPNLPTGTEPVSLALHPTVNNTGQFLFVSNSDSDNLSVFSVSTITGAMSSPLTVIAPATPSGLAVH